jgi:glycosyltransferase involved in cell wall biosynthesis
MADDPPVPERMRILHVLNHTERLNGNVHAAIDLACAQARLGHSVTLCSGGGSFDDLLRAHDIDVVRVDQKRRPLNLLRAVLALDRHVRSADIVHAHMMTSALLVWPSCLLRGVSLVTTVHNAFERSAIAMGVGRRVIAVSAAVGRSMARRGIPARRLRVVLNGTIGSARLDPEPDHPAPLSRTPPTPPAGEAPSGRIADAPDATGPNLLFVGGLHPRKGVADLLDAFERVHAGNPGSRLTLVGEGPYEAAYRAQAARMTCASAVTFAGGQSNPRPFLAAADIFILPSLADPAPLVLSEARASGCAVVATAVDGIPELLENGRAGILVPPSDPVRLGDAILSLVEDPRELALWQRNSQYNIEHLSITRVVRETLAVYAECLRPIVRQPPLAPVAQGRTRAVDGEWRD